MNGNEFLVGNNGTVKVPSPAEKLSQVPSRIGVRRSQSKRTLILADCFKVSALAAVEFSKLLVVGRGSRLLFDCLP